MDLASVCEVTMGGMVDLVQCDLDEQPPAMGCKRCNEVFEVAWGELYFGGGETRDSDVDLE